MCNINFIGNVDSDLLKACHVNIKGLVLTFQLMLATNCLAKMPYNTVSLIFQVSPEPPRTPGRTVKSSPVPTPIAHWASIQIVPEPVLAPNFFPVPLPPTKALLSLLVVSQLRY